MNQQAETCKQLFMQTMDMMEQLKQIQCTCEQLYLEITDDENENLTVCNEVQA